MVINTSIYLSYFWDLAFKSLIDLYNIYYLSTYIVQFSKKKKKKKRKFSYLLKLNYTTLTLFQTMQHIWFTMVHKTPEGMNRESLYNDTLVLPVHNFLQLPS